MGGFRYPMLAKDGRTHAGFVKQEQPGLPVALVSVRARPPESMETVGRYAVLTDPTGAAFGIHRSASQPE
jgi:hypothetical protein